MLFLGRIHPVKGVDNLLRAWVAVQQKFPQWHLLIVGPGDADYLREMLSLATALGAARTNFHGPLYGADKIAAFRAADLFVLPTYSENFGIAVAEALAAECPVITTKGAPWSGLISRQAGWWIDIGVAPLVSAFEQAMSQTPETLRAMGAAGRVWMQDEFSWQNIGSRMVATYSWVQNGGPIPPWIRIG
ncbi:hypothetical protein X737_31905 [Mesorhizobium sp. L48C026A00]|nr:hypothetical protein X737_31905 [Mesorhizobium sp. L48C026A00]